MLCILENMCWSLSSASCFNAANVACTHVQANAEKKRLEVKQRAVRKAAEQNQDPLEPRWFQKIHNGVAGKSAMYTYKGGYWEARKAGDWTGCRDIFGCVS